MYLSEAGIVFPAIFIDSDFFSEVDPQEVTAMWESILEAARWRGDELCDSAGRRFEVVGIRVLERLRPGWRWWLPGWLISRAYRVDLELKELPPQPFEQILARLVEMEREKAWEMQWTPEHPDFIAHLDELRSCKSIADVVAFDRKLSGLPPDPLEARPKPPLPPPADPR